jgi:hypothetical protein
MVRVLLKLREAPAPFDTSDALGVAITHMHHASAPRDVKTKTPPARAKLEALLAANPRRRAPR